MTESFEVNEHSEVYYTGTYWNDYEAVRNRINRLISGDPTRPWYEHFADKTERTFKRALILNCGNGWVERDLVEHGLIAEGVGMDYSQPLLDEAGAVARENGLPLTYVQSNINDAVFPEGEFDLVVNYAAAHHIAAIDRVFREICRVLPEDGWFVSYDYIGPHRNQYGLEAWEAAWTFNRELPESLRQDLYYPHLPTMLVTDPTEAIHSELILETFHRYFTTGEFTPLGGAIAYHLLTHNARMSSSDDEEQRTLWIDRILEADDRFLAEHPESTLFAYFAGQPDKPVLQDAGRLATWRTEEVERERVAQEEGGGEYYERGPLAVALIELEEERTAHVRAHARAVELESELQAMRSGFLYSRARRLVDSKWVRHVRGNRAVSGLERRARAAHTPRPR
jgi:SAM-dependent methyltransferase